LIQCIRRRGGVRRGGVRRGGVRRAGSIAIAATKVAGYSHGAPLARDYREGRIQREREVVVA
jgi:hypothetical protein